MKNLIKLFSVLIFTVNFAFAENLKILTLEDCISTALQKNLQLKITEQKIRQSQFNMREVRGKYLPALNLTGNYTHLSEVPSLTAAIPLLKYYPQSGGSVITGFQSNSETFGNQNAYIVKVGLVQPIYTSGKLSENYKQTKLDCEYEQLEYDKTKSDLTADVKKAFFKTLLAKEFVKIADEEVEVTEQHYQTALSLYKQGKSSEYDVSRVKVQLANSRTQLIETKNNLFLAKKDLANLINLTEAGDFDLASDLQSAEIKMPEKSLSDCTDSALRNRNELKQISVREKISQSIIKSAKNENRPNLNLLSNFYEQKPYYFVQDWTNLWDVTLSLTFPIFNGFSDRARVGYNESQLSEIQTTREMLVNSIKLQIEKIYFDLLNAKERIDVQKENVRTAEDNLKIAQEKYKYGLVPNLEVNDAELALRQSEMNYSKAVYDYKIAEIDLNQASGSGNF